MASAFRIVRPRFAATAMDGEGARLYGGRWNPPGVPVVYLAASRALAALEMLVHLDGPARRAEFAVIEVEFDAGSVAPAPRLPRGWRRSPAMESARRFGADWAASASSLLLELPSAVVPEESIFLFNPRHPEAGSIRTGAPRAFSFDPRLSEENA
jgi:RES domain-containing protein